MVICRLILIAIAAVFVQKYLITQNMAPWPGGERFGSKHLANAVQGFMIKLKGAQINKERNKELNKKH